MRSRGGAVVGGSANGRPRTISAASGVIGAPSAAPSGRSCAGGSTSTARSSPPRGGARAGSRCVRPAPQGRPRARPAPRAPRRAAGAGCEAGASRRHRELRRRPATRARRRGPRGAARAQPWSSLRSVERPRGARLDRARADAERGRRLLLRQAEQVAAGEHEPRRLGQLVQRGEQRGGSRRPRPRASSGDGAASPEVGPPRLAASAGPPPGGAAPVPRLVGDDPQQPGPERLGRPEPPERPPGLDDRPPGRRPPPRRRFR